MSSTLIHGHPASHWLTRMVAKVGEQLTDRNGEPLSKDAVRFVGRDTRNVERGKFGNPFSHNPRSSARWAVETREQAVQAFAIWLEDDEQAELRQAVVDELAGKVLVCHCQTSEAVGPPCHAEVLVRIANPQLAALERAERQESTPRKLDMRYASHYRTWAERVGVATAPKVLVTGDRKFSEPRVIQQRLQEFAPGHVVIEGEASGADRAARDAALALGMPVAGFPAQWEAQRHTPAYRIRTYSGRAIDIAAGPIRNGKMLDCDPDLVLAFHDDLSQSRGTLDMVRRALAAGKKVILSDSGGSWQELTADDISRMVGEDTPAEPVTV